MSKEIEKEAEGKTPAAPIKSPEEIAREYAKRVKERVMNPDDPFHLAGILPFEEGEFSHYVPEAFRGLPEEQRPVFYQDAYSREDVKKLRAASGTPGFIDAIIEAQKSSGNKGWANLKTRAGKEIEVGDKSFLDRLQEPLLVELHNVSWAFATGMVPIEEEGLG